MMSEKEQSELLEERYQLVLERIREIPGEQCCERAFKDYFDEMASFVMLLHDTKSFLKAGGLKTASLEELQRRNHVLYADVLPDHYEESYGNPAYAVKKLGKFGQELCWLYAELRRMIEYLYQGETEQVVIGLELFAEIYAAFTYEWNENQTLPSPENIRKTLYWYVSDYADIRAEREIWQLVCPQGCFAADIIKNSDLNDVRYLYTYGKYVDDNELETARYLAGLPEETIAAMADTYTEGDRSGVEVTGKD